MTTDTTTQAPVAPELVDAEAYTVTTPMGILKIWFPEEGGNITQGDAEAVDCLNDALRTCVGRKGQSLSLEGIEPIELEDYFDGAVHGITVLPPFDALLDSSVSE